MNQEPNNTVLIPIPNFPGYEITCDGRIWSTPRKNTRGSRREGRWLKPCKTQGYLCVNLSRGGKANLSLVHRLVLEAFVGPCPAGMECRHLDGNKTHNHQDNLKWGTHQENIQDAIQHKTHRNLHQLGEENPRAILTKTMVRKIRELYSSGKFFQRELAKKFGITQVNVSRIVLRKNWKHI